MAKSRYEIVQVGKKWQLRVAGGERGSFNTRREADEAARAMSRTAASIGRVHGDESELIAKRTGAGGPRSAQGTAQRQPGRAGR